MPDETMKEKLLALIHQIQEDQIRFWNTLSEVEHAAVGRVDDWAPKDIMAHVNFWNDRLAGYVEAAMRGEIPDPGDDYEHVNIRVFEENKDRSWQDLLVFEQDMFARLYNAVQALPEEALVNPEHFAWSQGQPLWWRVVSTPYYHGFWHLADILKARGDMDGAIAIHEQIAETLLGLDPADEWHGRTFYNLACFYSLNQMPERAIELLGEALERNPGLLEWSRQDKDLDPLRDLPAFQALYAR